MYVSSGAREPIIMSIVFISSVFTCWGWDSMVNIFKILYYILFDTSKVYSR